MLVLEPYIMDFICLLVCLNVCVHLCLLSVCVCLCMCLCVCLYVYVSICMFMCLCVYVFMSNIKCISLHSLVFFNVIWFQKWNFIYYNLHIWIIVFVVWLSIVYVFCLSFFTNLWLLFNFAYHYLHIMFHYYSCLFILDVYIFC